MIRLIAGTLALFTWSAFAADAPKVEMTRSEAMGAFNAIAAMGQYQIAIKQGGQDVPMIKFLDVSAPMRSTLIHDTAILHAISMETVALQEDAKKRLDGKELDAELGMIGQQKIIVEGLILFKEADLAFDKNPQITPLLGAALVVLETQ